MTPGCDNEAVMQGYTHPVYVEGGDSGFAALIRPDTDTEDRFSRLELLEETARGD